MPDSAAKRFGDVAMRFEDHFSRAIVTALLLNEIGRMLRLADVLLCAREFRTVAAMLTARQAIFYFVQNARALSVQVKT